MRELRVKAGAGLIVWALLSAPSLPAATLASGFSGSIAGLVKDRAGIPQMGAAVLLMNGYERVIGRAISNERGIFGFAALPPGRYSVRVSLASFVPALKEQIGVQPGMQSLLYITLASVLSSVELVYAAPGQGALMSDDWKWTLKSSTATRPILRLVDETKAAKGERTREPVFSDTSALVGVSGGDSEGASAMQPDLGTVFALATSLYGRNRLHVSGNFGYTSRNGTPDAGFRTTWSGVEGGPELSATVRQVYFGGRGTAGEGDGLPALRTLSLSFKDHVDFGDRLRLDYGSSLDSVSFLDHVNYVSPYGLLTLDMGAAGSLEAGFRSGVPPADGFGEAEGTEAQLQSDVAALAAMPRLSLADGQTRVQRTQNVEIGYRKRMGSRTLQVSAYREATSDMTLAAMAPAGVFAAGDLMPNLASNGSIFDAGNFNRMGYSGTLTQALGQRTKVSATYGRAGALAVGSATPSEDAALQLRSSFRTSERHWAAARIATVLPKTGTEISASYQWTQPGAILPEHYSITDGTYPEQGCNIHIRQPMPSIPGFPGRLEATADLDEPVGAGICDRIGSGGAAGGVDRAAAGVPGRAELRFLADDEAGRGWSGRGGLWSGVGGAKGSAGGGGIRGIASGRWESFAKFFAGQGCLSRIYRYHVPALPTRGGDDEPTGGRVWSARVSTGGGGV